ncbi:MAG: hypothetical protein ACJ76J_13100, partial [Thermoanaerobaculia bacterium]
SLEGLPAGLETLRVGESRLSDLSGMPPALTSLKLGSSRIERVASLPSGLRSLDLYFPTDPVMDFLPRSLESLRLEISENFLPLDFRRFKRLRSLTIHSRSGVERLSFRARLPAGLRSLELEGLDLQYSLAGLPMTIESLKLKSYGSNNSVNRIDVSHLRSLRSLTLDGGPVSLRLNTELLALMVDSSAIALEQLPESLRELEIRGRVVNEKELLVDNLEASRISDLRLPSGIESLALARLPPSLPKSLKRLKTSDPSHFPLPEGLESLHVEGEIDVPRLSRLPRSLKRLKVTELYNVPLPAGLKSLDLSRLLRPSGSNLPRLPDDLAELNLRGTDVRRLPSNLRRLTYLDISSTAIDSLKDLPRRLVYLDISSTPIDSLKGVPPSLKSLSLTIRQVKTLKGLPRSVTALHFHDDSVRLM